MPNTRHVSLGRTLRGLPLLIVAFSILTTGLLARPAWAVDGKVIDAATKQPIVNAMVTVGTQVVRTDDKGAFNIDGDGDQVMVRSQGYARHAEPKAGWPAEGKSVALKPFRPKGLYLSGYGIASSKLREAALQTMRNNGMNALVIDLKDDRGQITYKTSLPIAEKLGNNKLIHIKDLKELNAKLNEQGIYTIGRIVTFKDDPLAAARPDLAVHAKGGAVFRDREKLRWVDAFKKETWDYNIAIAKEVAEAGFDEVQFDYVRFPDNRGVVFSQPSNPDSRSAAITGFLKAAREALVPYNVFVAADIFGYVPWNTSDTDIGQKIVPITEVVDVVSMMVYPSGYHLGIPGYRNPIKNPYEIVLLTHKRAQERTKAPALHFRPWLQAFRDYAFGGQQFGENELRLQVKAANDFGANGYMFWNPRNVYPTSGYKP